MNKYEHKIESYELTRSGVRCDFLGGISAVIDVLESGVFRVALKKNGAELPKTYAVLTPNESESIYGRDKLSTVGFSLPHFAFEDKDGKLSLTFSDTQILVDKAHFSLAVFYKGERLYRDRDTQCYNFYGELGEGARHYIKRERNEKEQIFGLGDKGGKVERIGGAYKMSCIDAMGYDAETTDPLYKAIPFYITKKQSGCYGVFYDTHADSEINLGKELDNYHGLYKYFMSEDDFLCYYVFTGGLAEIVASFSRLTGGSAFFPKWTLDYAGSTMAYTDSENSEELLYGFLDECNQNGIPCRSFYLSSGYSSIGKDRCVFHWNRDKFKEPRAFGARFLESGVRVIANIKPCFLTTHPLYAEMDEKGYFLKNADGTSALNQFWNGLGSYIDFTNKAAFDFWTDKVKTALIDNNILYTWNDNNEYEIWDKSVLCDNFGHPTEAYRIKQVFPYLMQLSSLAAQKSAAKENVRQFMCVRSCGAGLNRLSRTWTGDNLTDFKTLRFNHKQAMSLSLSAVFNFGHDVGGFAGAKPSLELFLRWIQNGIFTPRFAIHSWNTDGTASMPWMYEDALPSVKRLFQTRFSLLPYLYNAEYNSVKGYEPIIAPLFFRFDDQAIDVESDEFMFGRDVLVANVFDEGQTCVKCYLPKNEGGWYDAQGEHYSGGETEEMQCLPTDDAVYFFRAGSVVARNRAKCEFCEKPWEVELEIYAQNRGTFTATYFDDDGETDSYKAGDKVDLEIKVTCEEDRVVVCCKNCGKRDFSPKFKLIDFNKRQLVIEN